MWRGTRAEANIICMKCVSSTRYLFRKTFPDAYQCTCKFMRKILKALLIDTFVTQVIFCHIVTVFNGKSNVKFIASIWNKHFFRVLLTVCASTESTTTNKKMLKPREINFLPLAMSFLAPTRCLSN